ncbi:hypothetical protein JGS39_29550, partial [Streptomyces sp. P01-B04]|nr:hypothetical protein [Streptomyces poriferorum]
HLPPPPRGSTDGVAVEGARVGAAEGSVLGDAGTTDGVAVGLGEESANAEVAGTQTAPTATAVRRAVRRDVRRGMNMAPFQVGLDGAAVRVAPWREACRQADAKL